MIHGLKQRWLINSLVVVIIVVIVAVSAFSIAISNYYYSSMETGLKNKARTAADFFANYITKTYAEFYESAYKYTESFDESDRLELQFINTEGKVEISTYGITAGTSPGTTDIADALGTGEIGVFVGKSPLTGERIMAVSSPMIYSNNQVIGAMRYVSSMKLVDRQVTVFILLAVGVGLVILLMAVAVNMMFIRSVVEPMQDITVTAKRIAEGGYGIQIEKQYNDEIGEMVSAINEMSLKIGQTEKMQTEFVSSVSHELRTPLTAITGWGETLMYEENLDKDERRGIGIILSEARRLTKLVEELLEFTRMQDGRFTLNVEQVDIVAELEDSIFTYGELLKQENIKLEYEPYDDEIDLIPGDPARLKQVFLNILDNAAKYGREAGRIVVSIQADNDSVYIKFRDFGPGIPEDELPNVKMKFYKGSSKERGSGIGLAVCDEIVRLHNGSLDLVNAAEGGGLEVTVKLPRRSAA